MEIPVYYDPMIAKLITFGKDRHEAIERMIRAIDEYDITGIKTTLNFGKFVMQHEAFRTGKFDTHFVSKYFNAGQAETETEEEAMLAAIVSVILLKQTEVIPENQQAAGTASNWRRNRVKFNS